MKFISKIYIRDKKEIFEFSEKIIAENGSEEFKIINRLEQDLGDSISDFVSFDFKENIKYMHLTEQYSISLGKKNDIERFENALKELENIATHFENVEKSNIFFYPISNYIRRIIIEYKENERPNYNPKFYSKFTEKAGKNPTKYLACIAGDLQSFIPNVLNFINSCLDIDVKNNLTTEQKYLKFLSEERNFYNFEIFILQILGFPCNILSTIELMPTYDFDLQRVQDKINKKNLTDIEAKEIPLTFTEVFEPKDIFDYPKSIFEPVYFFCWHFIKNNIKFRKCKNCGKYFCIVGKLNTDYCNRLAKNSEKTCREVGALRKYKEKLLQNPINQLFTRAYKKYSARVRYKTIDKTHFELWSKIAREQRDKCLNNEISYEKFEDFLENFENAFKEE